MLLIFLLPGLSAASGVTLIKEIYHLSPDCSTPITSSYKYADFPTDSAGLHRLRAGHRHGPHGSMKDAWCDMSDPNKPKLHVKFYIDYVCLIHDEDRTLDTGECKSEADYGVKFTCLAPPSPPPPPPAPAIPMWAWCVACGVVLLAFVACVICFCRGPRGPSVGSPYPGQRQLPALGEPLNAGLLPVAADPGLSRAMAIPVDRGEADNNFEAVLINLKSLLDAGILTPEEFEAKKAEVLKGV